MLPGGWEFPYDDVLNHRLEHGVIVSPTCPLEGFLLGLIFEGFPAGLIPGVPVATSLEIYDGVGEVSLVDLQFVVEPCPIRKTRVGTGLYGETRERAEQIAEVARHAYQRSYGPRWQ
jgi:hypothetical protein